jgi:tetraacyldisaccharide 4'-kinase
MDRRGNTHRLIRWLWTARRLDARVARLALLPAAGLWRAATTARGAAYARGWLAARELPLPAVAVGNLTVGGSGKTPIALWIARRFAAQGLVPGILLRGYGGDETLVHRRALPAARVVANPDRVAGAERARDEGAEVLVLDDAFQRVDVARDLNVVVLSTEASRAVRWPLPAGPWREGWGALSRADAAVVTRKRAGPEEARSLAAEVGRWMGGPVAVAHLGLRSLEGMLGGAPTPASALAGKRVIVASAIGDPDAFVGQVKAVGAAVQVAAWRDHHRYRDSDVAWLARAARRADHLVVTEKDAVKLRDRWPAAAPEPLVAVLDLQWEGGNAPLLAALDTVAARARPSPRAAELL